jgi:hypothetical protein
MRDYSLTHVRDAVLLRDLAALVGHERVTLAVLLAHLAEVDARRLYVPAGFSSMHAYCVNELRFSDDAAYKRIQAARAARKFPTLFAALAEGRLHLTALCLLAPHLTPENVLELVEAATHRRQSEIEAMLARRFSLPAVPESPRTIVRAIPAMTPSPTPQLAVPQVDCLTLDNTVDTPGEPTQRENPFGGEAEPPLTPSLTHPSLPPPIERYLVKLTIEKSTHDKLRYAQTLLSHAVPSGDVAQVLDRALDTLIAELEKRKFGAGARRPAQHRRSRSARHIPAHVRRVVWERDGGRCTFVSASGHRCEARTFLEYDHIDPVARGGSASVERMRLRCRTHNQLEAERAFGAGFMARKREDARGLPERSKSGQSEHKD